MISRVKMMLTFFIILVSVFFLYQLYSGGLCGNEAGKTYEMFDYACVGRHSDDIYMEVDCGKISVIITPSVNADGEYMFFLPSKAQSFKFGNVDLKQYDCNSGIGTNELIGEVKFDSCNLDFDQGVVLTKKEEYVGAETIMVYKSDAVPTLYIECEESQDVLDGEFGKECDCSVSYIGTEKSIFREKCEYIKTRGNTTFQLDKKPYQLKLKRSMSFGMDSNEKTWILLANHCDRSKLKNDIIYRFANDYTPLKASSGEFVDLFINGDYRGCYYLCTKPQMGSALGLLEGYELDEKGYLVEFTWQLNEEDVWFETASGKTAKVRFPQNAQKAEVEYIKDKFDSLERAIDECLEGNSTSFCEIEKYIDVDSYVYKYLIESLFANPDAGLASSYFYMNSGSADGKIYAGPVWDYDLAFYQGQFYDSGNIEQIGAVYLCDKLLQIPQVKEKCYNIYTKNFKPYFDYCLKYDMYELEKHISSSRELDAIRWDYELGEEYVNQLYDIAIGRMDTVEKRILIGDEYVSAKFLDYEGNILTIRTVKKGDMVGELPNVASWVAVFTGWRNVETGTLLTEETRVYKDEIFASEWIDTSVIVQNGIDQADIDFDEIQTSQLEAILDEILKRKLNE